MLKEKKNYSQHGMFTFKNNVFKRRKKKYSRKNLMYVHIQRTSIYEIKSNREASKKSLLFNVQPCKEMNTSNKYIIQE